MAQVKYTFDIDVSFDSYKTQQQNQNAIKMIRRWLEDSIRDMESIPLYIVKNAQPGTGYIEDHTSVPKIKCMKIKEKS